MSITGERPAWMADGACSPDTADLFFPERGDSDSVARAKAICATCPVLARCRSYAVVNVERRGIWGGLSQRELRQARLRRAGRAA